MLALRRRVLKIDILRVRDEGRTGHPDSSLLEWAAGLDRLVITHDVRTMPRAAFARVAERKPMAGVLIVPDHAPARELLDDLALIAEASSVEEWRDRVVFLPLPRLRGHRAAKA